MDYEFIMGWVCVHSKVAADCPVTWVLCAFSNEICVHSDMNSEVDSDTYFVYVTVCILTWLLNATWTLGALQHGS